MEVFSPAVPFASHYFDNVTSLKHTQIHKHRCKHEDVEHILVASICQGASDSTQGKHAMPHGFLRPPWLQDQDQTVRRGVDRQDSSPGCPLGAHKHSNTTAEQARSA